MKSCELCIFCAFFGKVGDLRGKSAASLRERSPGVTVRTLIVREIVLFWRDCREESMLSLLSSRCTDDSNGSLVSLFSRPVPCWTWTRCPPQDPPHHRLRPRLGEVSLVPSCCHSLIVGTICSEASVCVCFCRSPRIG